ncbi:MAG: hypothetical protein IK990_10095 [Ruminiclostridium sp.]|nr:hypothetical protein [Ruminiclostridium sp.]
MRRNELLTTSAVENKDVTTNSTSMLTDEQKHSIVTAMKIAYYKDFYRRGIITADQLEQLLAMQPSAQNSQTDNAA